MYFKKQGQKWRQGRSRSNFCFLHSSGQQGAELPAHAWALPGLRIHLVQAVFENMWNIIETKFSCEISAQQVPWYSLDKASLSNWCSCHQNSSIVWRQGWEKEHFKCQIAPLEVFTVLGCHFLLIFLLAFGSSLLLQLYDALWTLVCLPPPKNFPD